jgi:hypothetical protein
MYVCDVIPIVNPQGTTFIALREQPPWDACAMPSKRTHLKYERADRNPTRYESERR